MSKATRCNVCRMFADGDPPEHWIRLVMRVPESVDWISATSQWTVAGYIDLSGDYCSLACLQARLATVDGTDLTTRQVGRENIRPWLSPHVNKASQ